ncbi:MAG: 16S rRNA (cytidine(1402)-2'-O)-methyltransferase [Rhodospirillaceae bacterium]|nr:16S rRNA (cytidine(1402)-2'-O)-methyltransferase [Rhodospirillaceae bacterium]|tara:strand:- start:1973 stop:2824 length:852 start_codon:yes stop_codon:yes gene_type:complete
MTITLLSTGLTLVATPIGNMLDISKRAMSALAEADEVLCEDSRVSRKLLSRYGIKTKLRTYHEHNASKVRPKILEKLKSGAKIVLISDAGTPTISDPGYKLIRACIDSDIRVSTIPGPTAVIAALSISGLPTNKFYFGGFLPTKTNARKKILNTCQQLDATMVFYESPSRLAACLEDATVYFGERSAAVARELTKLHEEVRRGTVAELSKFYSSSTPPKGEAVLLIGPPDSKAVWNESAVERALSEALMSNTLRDAVQLVAAASGVSKSIIYDLALELNKPKS